MKGLMREKNSRSMMMQKFKSIVLLVIAFLLSGPFVFADSWDHHLAELAEVEHNINKLQEEMDTLVKRKKNTRDQARIEETLQRIVEIHAELIAQRKIIDDSQLHAKAEHADLAHVINGFDKRTKQAHKQKSKYGFSPLGSQLDALLVKIQLKYSTFIRTEEPKEELVAVEKLVQKKRKKKREREADVYLRRRSTIKLSK